MRQIKLGICIEDGEYSSRFTGYIMNHYQDKFDLYLYSGIDQLIASEIQELDILLCDEKIENIDICCPVVILAEKINDIDSENESEGGAYVIDRYQEANNIVDQVLKQIGTEIRDLKEYGEIRGNTEVIAVYSLSENELQLPFAVTMGSIIGESKKVLMLDLQENSGLSQLLAEAEKSSLEELLIMAQSGKYNHSKILSAIDHLDKVDVVCPIANSDSLCETESGTYIKLIRLLSDELDYDVLIVNLGTRFVGFSEVLNQCRQIYLMQKKGGLYQWREYEFIEELMNKGYKDLVRRIRKVEMPFITNPVTSCERLIEQWRWNEFGDVIRSVSVGERCVG